MPSTTAKRNPVRRRFERELERALDGMKANREERLAARATFRNLVDTAGQVRMGVAKAKAISVAQSARDARTQTSRDTAVEAT